MTFSTKPAGFATDGGDSTDDGIDVFGFFNGRGEVGANEAPKRLRSLDGPSGDGIAVEVDICVFSVFIDKTRVPG